MVVLLAKPVPIHSLIIVGWYFEFWLLHLWVCLLHLLSSQGTCKLGKHSFHLLFSSRWWLASSGLFLLVEFWSWTPFSEKENKPQPLVHTLLVALLELWCKNQIHSSERGTCDRPALLANHKVNCGCNPNM